MRARRPTIEPSSRASLIVGAFFDDAVADDAVANRDARTDAGERPDDRVLDDGVVGDERRRDDDGSVSRAVTSALLSSQQEAIGAEQRLGVAAVFPLRDRHRNHSWRRRRS